MSFDLHTAIRRRRCVEFATLLIAALSCSASASKAGTAIGDAIAPRACSSLVERVQAIPAGSAVFLRSYDHERGSGEPAEPALRTAAFTYDNALAVVALIACKKIPEALRIGEALRLASAEPRLRNVYRAGPVTAHPLPNGWWDAKENRWVEDAYQMGTATGNAAWIALAFLNLYAATADKRWLDAAAICARWIARETIDVRGAGGFRGGIFGFDQSPVRVTWKSTEHNADLVAVYSWLAHAQPQGGWVPSAASARRFLDAQWDSRLGRFSVGTLPDGITVNRANSGLDAELWPLLLPAASPEWTRALQYVEHEFAVDGGFDFNDDRDGLWVEGTAQAALVEYVVGRNAKAKQLLSEVSKQFSGGGFVYATRETRITTGLANGPDSASADFYYYRRPHLGATSWVALAALGWNPFEAGGAKEKSVMKRISK